MLAGVGGQGILFATNVLVRTALRLGMEFSQSEVHGLSQRYGSIHTELRIGEGVLSPLILQGTLDLLIALEPLEALRHADQICSRTTIVLNTHLIPPPIAYLERMKIPSCDEVIEILSSLSPKRILSLDATRIASEEVGDPITTNSVMLGAASATGVLPFPPGEVRRTLGELSPPHLRDANLKAFDLGIREVTP